MKTVLITGVTGQDGAWLAKQLLEQGDKVVGTHRSGFPSSYWRLDELGIRNHPRLTLVQYETSGQELAQDLIERAEPDEVYNLAAQSFVGVSFVEPAITAQSTALAPLYLLEAIRRINPRIRFYQACSSEMFGRAVESPQTELTPFAPVSPYGTAKLYGYWITRNYRDAYGIHATAGILFNHESPLRDKRFVTRKISDAAARIKLGLQDELVLGNLNARRDWGWAPEFVDGMIRILRHHTPESFVLATGKQASIRDFVVQSFRAVGIELHWTGQGVDERGVCTQTGRQLVRVSPEFFRPTDIDLVVGDPAKARHDLNWVPSVELESICTRMVEADLARLTEKGEG